MTRLVVAAALVGSTVAALTGDGRQLPVRLWLLAAAVWLARLVVGAVLDATPPEPARWLPWFGPDRAEPVDHRPRTLKALHGTLLNARDNDRAFALRLQPRLVALADHRLAVDHGIDRRTEPDRAAAVLGPSGVLLDPVEEGRVGQPAAIDDLLDRLGVPEADGHPDPDEPRERP